jgi:hypothetical protein
LKKSSIDQQLNRLFQLNRIKHYNLSKRLKLHFNLSSQCLKRYPRIVQFKISYCERILLTLWRWQRLTSGLTLKSLSTISRSTKTTLEKASSSSFRTLILRLSTRLEMNKLLLKEPLIRSYSQMKQSYLEESLRMYSGSRTRVT